MREASTTLRLPAGATALLRLGALASLAFISAAGLSLAKDRCADTAEAVRALHPDDHYQATTLLFAAARLGCEAEARALLDRGAAIDAKDREGKTALAKAAEADKLPLIRLLLERGANVNARAVDGSTPLFYAAEQDRGAVIALLLERGADPKLPGRKGVRPLAAIPTRESFSVNPAAFRSDAPSDASSSAPSTEVRNAVSPPAKIPRTRSGETPKVGGHSEASSTPNRPEVPAPI